MTKDETSAPIPELVTQRPECILSAMGDLVFDGDDGYEELLISWRVMQAEEL